MSTLRIRFRFNQQTGKASVEPGGKHFGNFSRVLVQQVAVQYGNSTLGLIRDHIESQIQTDVQRELDHMARLLMTHVVGIAGRNSGPTGALGTVAPESEEMRELGLQVKSVSLRGLVREGWTPRSPYYLKWRARHGGSTDWFRLHSPSRLDALRSGSTWTAAFGGITVSVLKHTDLEKGEQSFGLLNMPYGSAGTRIGIATIRVAAMSRITPEMLPALAGGSLGSFGSNPQHAGLLSMLGDPIAWRLGGDPVRVPFRPTIQPFLGFFLTRALPNAVAKRIEQGFAQTRWKWEQGSVGRTR
jgi:hypothetical protein